MNLFRSIVITAAAAASVLAPVTASAQGYPQTVYVDANGYAAQSPIAPPDKPQEVVPPSPGPGYIWVSGFWQWDGAQYTWLAGHWELPPSANMMWVEPQWIAVGPRMWGMRPGAWRPAFGATVVRPVPYAQPAYVHPGYVRPAYPPQYGVRPGWAPQQGPVVVRPAPMVVPQQWAPRPAPMPQQGGWGGRPAWGGGHGGWGGGGHGGWGGGRGGWGGRH